MVIQFRQFKQSQKDHDNAEMIIIITTDIIKMYWTIHNRRYFLFSNIFGFSIPILLSVKKENNSYLPNAA